MDVLIHVMGHAHHHVGEHAIQVVKEVVILLVLVVQVAVMELVIIVA